MLEGRPRLENLKANKYEVKMPSWKKFENLVYIKVMVTWFRKMMVKNSNMEFLKIIGQMKAKNMKCLENREV